MPALASIQAIARLHARRPALALALLHRLRPGLAAGSAARGQAVAHRTPKADPTDHAVARRAQALGEAYQGALAPMRQAILDSTSPEDALGRARAAFSGWRPHRVAALVEEGLQLAAAAGAGDLPPRTGRHA